jgi:hypothetical protein
MRRIITTIGIALAIAGAGAVAAPASADPITCPPGQTVTKVDDWWSCVNNPGHEDESGDSKNPNGNPNFRR